MADVDLIDVEKQVLFVDDGSTDQTLSVIKKASKKSLLISYLSFSRSFGKEAAMYAGLEHATGALVSFIDVDLQDPVDLLPEMCKEVLSGHYDAVAARRVSRSSQNFIRGFLSNGFYWTMNKIFDIDLVSGERDYRVMNRDVFVENKHRPKYLVNESSNID